MVKSIEASKIPFISNLKKPACASKRDVLELATLRYSPFFKHISKTKSLAECLNLNFGRKLLFRPLIDPWNLFHLISLISHLTFFLSSIAKPRGSRRYMEPIVICKDPLKSSYRKEYDMYRSIIGSGV